MYVCMYGIQLDLNLILVCTKLACILYNFSSNLLKLMSVHMFIKTHDSESRGQEEAAVRDK